MELKEQPFVLTEEALNTLQSAIRSSAYAHACVAVLAACGKKAKPDWQIFFDMHQINEERQRV